MWFVNSYVLLHYAGLKSAGFSVFLCWSVFKHFPWIQQDIHLLVDPVYMYVANRFTGGACLARKLYAFVTMQTHNCLTSTFCDTA